MKPFFTLCLPLFSSLFKLFTIYSSKSVTLIIWTTWSVFWALLMCWNFMFFQKTASRQISQRWSKNVTRRRTRSTEQWIQHDAEEGALRRRTLTIQIIWRWVYKESVQTGSPKPLHHVRERLYRVSLGAKRHVSESLSVGSAAPATLDRTEICPEHPTNVWAEEQDDIIQSATNQTTTSWTFKNCLSRFQIEKPRRQHRTNIHLQTSSHITLEERGGAEFGSSWTGRTWTGTCWQRRTEVCDGVTSLETFRSSQCDARWVQVEGSLPERSLRFRFIIRFLTSWILVVQPTLVKFILSRNCSRFCSQGLFLELAKCTEINSQTYIFIT